MNIKSIAVLLVIFLCGSLTGCGQTGRLYLPPPGSPPANPFGSLFKKEVKKEANKKKEENRKQ